MSDRFDVTSTYQVLDAATRDLTADEEAPDVLTDGGPENRNPVVDDLVESGRLRTLLAMTDIMFSNSMVESWFRAIKHQWLFLNTLDSPSAVRRLVAFYVEQHNTVLPHSAFRGQTPDEMYFGIGADIPTELESAKTAARELRMEKNRQASCEVCSDSWEEVSAAS